MADLFYTLYSSSYLKQNIQKYDFHLMIMMQNLGIEFDWVMFMIILVIVVIFWIVVDFLNIVHFLLWTLFYVWVLSRSNDQQKLFNGLDWSVKCSRVCIQGRLGVDLVLGNRYKTNEKSFNNLDIQMLILIRLLIFRRCICFCQSSFLCLHNLYFIHSKIMLVIVLC